VGAIVYGDPMLVKDHPVLQPTTAETRDRQSPGSLSVAIRNRTKRSSRLLVIATVLITGAFLYFALSNIDLSLAWRALRTSDYWWLLAAFAAFALGNVARAIRWRSLFAHGRRPPTSTVG